MKRSTPWYLFGGVVAAVFVYGHRVKRIGKYYTLDDVIASDEAKRLGLVPQQRAISTFNILNAERLAYFVLDPAIKFLGSMPVLTSWYRSPRLNVEIGGADGSKHLDARAADLKYYVNGRRRNDLLARAFLQRSNFDRMILEYGTKLNPSWIHIEVAPIGFTPRREILYARKTSEGTVFTRVTAIEALQLFA